MARSLTHNISGGIEDFQFYVERVDDDDLRILVQGWIDGLSDGRPPETIFEEWLNQFRAE